MTARPVIIKIEDFSPRGMVMIDRQDDSVVRVRSVFQELFRFDPTGMSWLKGLVSLAVPFGKRVPEDLGTIDEKVLATRFQTVLDAENLTYRRVGIERAFERRIPPAQSFLEWAVDNVAELDVNMLSRKMSPESRERRRKLFQGDKETLALAKGKVRRLGARKCDREWWAFEEHVVVDCLLETDKAVLAFESLGKGASSRITWYAERHYLIRVLEALTQYAGEKYCALVLLAQSEEEGTKGFSEALESNSLPHLEADMKQSVLDGFLGYITFDRLKREGLYVGEGN